MSLNFKMVFIAIIKIKNKLLAFQIDAKQQQKNGSVFCESFRNLKFILVCNREDSSNFKHVNE